MANYTFIPYLRRGIVGLAKDNAEKNRLTVPLRLQVVGEGETPALIERNAQLYGPGDVTGLNGESVVRTVPRANVNDFEANFLAAIEFYDEDLLWRYSPILPDAQGKLKPWLWLTVLEESEYQRIQGVKNQTPVIEISADALHSAFPDPDTTPAWAHVHLNFKPEGNTAKVLGMNIQQKLDGDPNLGCSRLVCPRRLRPNTRYRGFLLPAFEKGRLAGLGRPETEIANIANVQPAWRNDNVTSIPFPVYYEWGFSTASEGDFEDLARKLTPLTPEEQKDLTDAAKRIDVRNVGWGIKGAKGSIRLESALKLPSLAADTADETNDKKTLREKITPLLNLSLVPLNTTTGKNTPHPYFKSENNPNSPSNLDDDPIITPPLYGSFYRPSEALNAANTQDWYAQLNLNPVYRVAAAQGTGVVQENQEELMDSAWEQWSTYIETWKIRCRWEFSEQLSQTMSEKRMKPMTVVSKSLAQYRSAGFFSPLLPTLKSDGRTDDKFSSQVIAEADKPSTFSRTFSKITRTGGPLMRRMTDRVGGQLYLDLPRIIPSVIAEPPLQRAANAIITWSNNNPNETGQLKNMGLTGVDALKVAASLWLPYVRTKSTPVVIRRTDVHKKVVEDVWVQINPKNTIMARFTTMVLNITPVGSGVQSLNLPQAPVFKDATYKPLSERNTDFILPGLDKIPQNRVAILQANTAFIESYLVGLNHEMAREFLWREFPAPLNATYFRQFWDMRDTATPKPDIQPVLNWSPNTLLGTHRAGAGQAGFVEPLVVVIRGDLLRKYPNTEIFMVKADWDNKPIGSHKLVLDPSNAAQWNNDAPDLRRPVFSARIEPDYILLGFNLGIEEAKGNAQKPGWFFVLKERAGDVHFGLDLKAEPNNNDPSWEQLAEVGENHCIQVNSAKFAALPRSGKRADQVASMLWQKPFMLFVHASRLLV